MKFALLPVFILIILFSCSERYDNTVTIKGKINGEIPEEIFYTYPVRNTYLYGLRGIAIPDSSGNFEIEIDVEEAAFSYVVVYGRVMVNLLIEPGKNYEVNLQLGEESTFKIQGDFKEGQELLNSFPDPAHAQFEAREYMSYTDAKKIETQLDSILNVELESVDSLLREGLVSESFCQLLKTDRKVFYDAVKGNLAQLKWSNDKRKNDGSFTKGFETMWNNVVDHVSLADYDVLKSQWAFNLIETFLNNKQYLAPDYKPGKFSEMRKKGLRHTHKLSFVDENLDGLYKEWYTATYLLFHGGMQKRYQEEFISLFKKFDTEFLESEYTQHLESFVADIVGFHETANNEFPEGVNFVDGFENFNSLKETVKLFEGKMVYVDIWSTSCGPCKEEFKHKNQLNELLKLKNIESLYICLNGDSGDKQWKDMIKFYKLEGNHIRANSNLKNDLRNILGSYGIPRYLIIDENGNIVNNYAPRPGNIDELKTEIEKHL